MASDIIILGGILWRERETMNLYKELSAKVSNPKLRSILKPTTDEEREPVAEREDNMSFNGVKELGYVELLNASGRMKRESFLSKDRKPFAP